MLAKSGYSVLTLSMCSLSAWHGPLYLEGGGDMEGSGIGNSDSKAI